MALPPASPRNHRGRHARPRAVPEVVDAELVEPDTPSLDDTTVIDVDVIDLPTDAGHAADGPTPLVTTGRAAGRWVKWLRARGEEPPPSARPTHPVHPGRAGRHAAPTPPETPPEAPAPPTKAPPAPPVASTAHTETLGARAETLRARAENRATRAEARRAPAEAPGAPPQGGVEPTAAATASSAAPPAEDTAAPTPVTVRPAGKPARPTEPTTTRLRTVPAREAPASGVARENERANDEPRTRTRTAGRTGGGWRAYLRAGLLVGGALGIQLAFVLSYVGAWNTPVADGLPVAIVTSPSVEQFQARIDRDSDAIGTRTFTDRGDAFEALGDQDVHAVFVSGRDGLELHLASAASGTAADTLTQLYGEVSTATGAPLEVYDDYPLPPTDDRGIAPFYLVVGWVVGGYLVSTLLSFIAGSYPEPRRGRIRVLALLLYSVLSGIGGAAIVGPMLGIWQGNTVGLAALGVLVVFGASVTAAALSALFGAVGTGLTFLLLVVLGNPGSGGPFPPGLLPEPFHDLHTWMLTGAATDATRSIVYFGGQGVIGAYLVLLLWCGFGSALYLTSSTVRGYLRRPTT
ncbi:hypothetical protein [Cryptosporangium minutisporangium]|uniref:DUF3533 domain-containing protein n=1 Tax=Cryptosporangium minutisporangium TaxID=113569 RepID=A0ABP6TAD1_9ACTN